MPNIPLHAEIIPSPRMRGQLAIAHQTFPSPIHPIDTAASKVPHERGISRKSPMPCIDDFHRLVTKHDDIRIKPGDNGAFARP